MGADARGGVLHARRVFLVMCRRVAISVADAARASLGSDLENTLAPPRAFAAVDGGPSRSVARADDFCRLLGGTRVFGDSLALRVRALRQGVGGAVEMILGVDPPSTSDLYR